jgi:hypothetical protein
MDCSWVLSSPAGIYDITVQGITIAKKCETAFPAFLVLVLS